MESSDFTQDGSVDLHGRPVLAAQTGKWKACSFILVYEVFERMAFVGVGADLVNYLTRQLHQDNVSSVRNVGYWVGTVWLTPILGAYVADTYLGRFWTFTISSFVYVLGMVFLTLAESIETSKKVTFVYFALYVIAVGAGGTKANISTFGADQFDDFDPHEKEFKVSFFNWWMFSSFLGSLVATLVLIYIEEDIGWGIGYGIATIGIIVSLVVFYIGTPRYRHRVRNKQSPTKDIAKVLSMAYANRHLKAPADSNELYELEHHDAMIGGRRRLHHTTAFRFLDKAALKESKNPCTVTEVEETKLVLGMAVILLATFVPTTINAQVNTLFVKQGTTLDRSLGHDGAFKIKAASLISFVTVSMLLAIPIYDRLFVPFMQRRTGNPSGITLLQRLGTGFAFHVLVMLVAFLVERKRMGVIRACRIVEKDVATVPMSVLWLMPQYALLGVGDVFNVVAVVEFFYDQSPEGMRSLGTALYTSGVGVGSFVNSFLVTAVDEATRRWGGKSWIGDNLNDSHFDYYYAILMLLSVLNLVAFVVVARGYNYKEKETIEVDMEEK